MMATDSKGRAVGFGDYLSVEMLGDGGPTSAIVRVIALRETTRGTSATGAYVALEGNGRVAKVPFTPSSGTLVMKSDGTEVRDA